MQGQRIIESENFPIEKKFLSVLTNRKEKRQSSQTGKRNARNLFTCLKTNKYGKTK
jgi:hypothetical protein